MKKQLILLFCCYTFTIFSQKKVEKDFQTATKEIEISTIGLDNFLIENSSSTYVEIILFAENMHQQEILISEQTNKVAIQFQLDSLVIEEDVFRKFITKRLQRAYAVIKVPKGKNITILGENCDIESNNYGGDLTIFIDKGNVKLHTIQANANIQLYAGTVNATAKNCNVLLHSNIGAISVDDVYYQKDYQKKEQKTQQKFTVNTIKGIILVTTQ